MLRKLVLLWGVIAMLSGKWVFAEIDLSDFDDDLMRDMDDAVKDLEPVLGAKNAAAATADAEVLRNGFKWTEDYFARKGSATDAVEFARTSQQLTAAVLQHVAARDFDAAAAAARELSKSCRKCHDVYKPLTK